MIPQKRITSPDDMIKWTKSQAYSDIMGFIQSVNRAVVGKKITDAFHVSEGVEQVCRLLEVLSEHVDAVPPLEQPQRFGNKAFRTWHAWMVEQAPSLLKEHLTGLGNEAEEKPLIVEELATYLCDSLGNATRIDYGTGHELAFLAFLIGLFRTGFLSMDKDLPAVGLRVMNHYMALARKLQTTYRMEPAGSQGVWSLDDFQFVPFIWGSAQFMANTTLEPKIIADRSMVETLHKDYLLFGCMKYIFEVKTGPFEEHSNTLYGISGVPFWEKVNSGLIKMYKGEVLSKFPIIQHFLFGSILTFDPVSPFKQPGPPPSLLKTS